MNKFLIASTMRSGSGLIADYLNSIKVFGVISNIEAFRKRLDPVILGHRSSQERGEELFRVIDPTANKRYKDNFGLLVSGDSILNTDWKTQYNVQSSDAIFEEFINKYVLPKFDKVIFITRDNKLEQAINTFYASSTGKWIDASDISRDQDKYFRLNGINPVRYKEKKTPNSVFFNIETKTSIPVKVEYNFMEIYAHLTRIYSEEDNWLSYLKLNNIQYLQVTYEDFIANKSTVLSQIFNYIGINITENFSLEEVSSSTRKKLVNPQLEDFTTRFKADYLAAFGKQYRNSRFTV